MSAWLTMHPFITFIIIYVCLTYVYNKVFRMRKLPLLKDAIVYALIGAGGFILLLFQHDLQLPIVQCLLVAVGLMFMVRIRYWLAARSGKDSRDRP